MARNYTLPIALDGSLAKLNKTLENIGVYPQVINNLTSESTDKPLSAKQGKVLNDAINAIIDDIEAIEWKYLGSKSSNNSMTLPSGWKNVKIVSFYTNDAVSVVMSIDTITKYGNTVVGHAGSLIRSAYISIGSSSASLTKYYLLNPSSLGIDDVTAQCTTYFWYN